MRNFCSFNKEIKSEKMNSLLFLFSVLFVTIFAQKIQLNNVFDNKSENLDKAINNTVNYLEKVRIDTKIPGIVAGISLNGKQVWAQGFGKTDIENNVTTRVDSVWRMASISKSLTSALMATLI